MSLQLYGTLDISRINETGEAFLLSLGIKALQTLTQKQIGDILSLQEKISLSDTTGRWQVLGKQKQGKHLNITRFGKKFFSGK